MAKSPDRFDSAIEKLLEERSQYQEWLNRLSDAGAPDAVRTRVRADYQARLDRVMEQLRSHEATITAELERHTAEQAELEERESQVLERLAEAQVRHSVGEFDDKQWNNLSTTQNKELADVRGGLERLRGEVSRLAEVQSLVSAAPEAAEPVAAPRFAPRPQPPAPSAAPSAAPMAEPPKPHGDELDFLKSVTVEQEQAASLSPSAAEKRRSSGGQPMVTTATPPPESMPQEASQPTTQASPPAPAAPPKQTPQAAPHAAKSSPATGSVKTLKCGECGTLNRPTEWYCERCGAELAAM